MTTRGELLRSSIAYALRKVRIADRRGRKLTEEERYAIADQVVALLKLYGDLWKLDEPVDAPVRPAAMSIWAGKE